MQKICGRLKEKCNLLPMDFSDFFASLSSGKADVAIGGIMISDSFTGYTFSLPYMLSKGQFLVRSLSPIHSTKDLINKNVGAILGEVHAGAFYQYLLSTYGDQINIKQYDNMEDVMNGLTKGEIDAAFLHEATVTYWRDNGGNQFERLSKPIPIGNGVGILSVPQQAPLIQRINQILQEMDNDSTFINLYNTYFSGDR